MVEQVRQPINGRSDADPKVVCGVFGKCRNGIVRLGLHGMQIHPYEKQYTTRDCTFRCNSAFTAVYHSVNLSPNFGALLYIRN